MYLEKQDEEAEKEKKKSSFEEGEGQNNFADYQETLFDEEAAGQHSYEEQATSDGIDNSAENTESFFKEYNGTLYDPNDGGEVQVQVQMQSQSDETAYLECEGEEQDERGKDAWKEEGGDADDDEAEGAEGEEGEWEEDAQ